MKEEEMVFFDDGGDGVTKKKMVFSVMKAMVL